MCKAKTGPDQPYAIRSSGIGSRVCFLFGIYYGVWTQFSNKTLEQANFFYKLY